jgi:hypothetical protein
MLTRKVLVFVVISLLIAALTITAAAQTQVTTDGSGQTNQVPKFSGSATIIGSAITENNGNVGIGTTNPQAKLQVANSDASTNNWIGVSAIGSGSLAGFILGGANGLFTGGDYWDIYQMQGNLKTLYFDGPNPNVTGNPQLVLLQAGGNVGIGTTAPAYPLDVAGYLRTTGGIVFPNGTIQTTAAASGGGTITGVTAGTGLTGGGTGGNVTLAVDSTVARTAGSQSFTGNQTVYGNLEIGQINNTGGGFTANGGAWVANNYGGVPFYVICKNLGACLSQAQNGSLSVSGNIYKGGGGFLIDHPLDPANKYLYHSFVESPDMKNIYDGVATLDGSGGAWVSLPNWFQNVNRDFRYQLTAIGAPAPGLYIASEVSGNQFQIAGGAPGMKVSWQVTGIRQDEYANANRIPLEEAKPKEFQGYYLHPDAFNQPASLAIGLVQADMSARGLTY